MNSTKNKKIHCLDKYTAVKNLHIFLNIVKNRVFMVEVENKGVINGNGRKFDVGW